jgi:hypothetical protein
MNQEFPVNDTLVNRPARRSRGRRTYDMRSVCGTTGCVATADAKEGTAIQPPLVFDQVDGAWLAVGIAPNSMA